MYYIYMYRCYIYIYIHIYIYLHTHSIQKAPPTASGLRDLEGLRVGYGGPVPSGPRSHRKGTDGVSTNGCEFLGSQFLFDKLFGYSR